MKMLKPVAIVLLASVSAVLLSGGQARFGAIAHAQDVPTSKITGVVLDPNEARIAGATIKVENGDFRREVLSNDEGYFEIELPVGAYHLTVEMEGFKKFKLSPFYARADVAEMLEVRMKVKPPASTLKV